jgi:hypothetical protein
MDFVGAKETKIKKKRRQKPHQFPGTGKTISAIPFRESEIFLGQFGGQFWFEIRMVRYFCERTFTVL